MRSAAVAGVETHLPTSDIRTTAACNRCHSLQLSAVQVTAQTRKLPVPATTQYYNYGFAGLGCTGRSGDDFHGFASYQFNELSFDNSFCATSDPCNRISNRHVVTFGLDWTPRPIRID